MVLNQSETVIGELRVVADWRQRDRLLRFAADFAPRTWAIESASGLGALLAQQVVAVGETVLDVSPTLSARVRLLDSGCTDKTDPHDARAAAVVALRHTRPRQVTPVIIRSAAPAGRPAPRPHRAESPGDLPAPRPALRLDAGRRRPPVVGPRGQILRGVRATRPVEIERKRITLELLGDVRRFDNQLLATNQRIVEAVVAPGTTVTDIHGIGPLGAAIFLGHTGDIDRFPTSGHFARYTDSAPIAASSGPTHPAPAQPSRQPAAQPGAALAAVTQVRNDTP